MNFGISILVLLRQRKEIILWYRMVLACQKCEKVTTSPRNSVWPWVVALKHYRRDSIVSWCSHCLPSCDLKQKAQLPRLLLGAYVLKELQRPLWVLVALHRAGYLSQILKMLHLGEMGCQAWGWILHFPTPVYKTKNLISSVGSTYSPKFPFCYSIHSVVTSAPSSGAGHLWLQQSSPTC